MTLAVVTFVGLVACAGLAAWLRRPSAAGEELGRAAAEATIRAALADTGERPVLAGLDRLAA